VDKAIFSSQTDHHEHDDTWALTNFEKWNDPQDIDPFRRCNLSSGLTVARFERGHFGVWGFIQLFCRGGRKGAQKGGT